MIRFFSKCFATALIATAFGFAVNAQTNVKEDLPKGWHLKDRAKDGYYGISLDRAYDLLKNKKSKTVVVAIIDSGIDTTHEDLRPVLWKNPKEIPGNGIDDDKNGYVDDIHGWNFIGGKDGRNVKEDSYEATRVYHRYKAKFQNISDPSTLSSKDKELYTMWKKAEQQVVGTDKPGTLDLFILRKTYSAAANSDSILQKAMNKEKFSGNELQAFTPTTDEVRKAKNAFLNFFLMNNSMDMTNQEFMEGFKEYLSGEERKAEASVNAPKDYRGEIVKDNEADINDRFYGNNDIMANTPFHGTHVAGIIAAARNNDKGINGIADNVKIMMIRAVPDGDEHDKDIALAIRYAVNNGAKVINMSFGKGFSPEKHWVDDAVKYAEGKGVLLVHAAGNDANDIDTSWNFPTPVFMGTDQRASNWITVGASGDPKTGGLVASFSNYGKKEVDVFAPGVKIYSSIPGGNTYGNAQGTSMASPVVAGVAALLLEYFPTLTPHQIKYIIEKSAVPITSKAKTPGSDKAILLADMSKTGGIVNAYEAIKLAQTFTAKTPKAQPVKIKPATPAKKLKAV
ncbi:MAG: S8 family peptidase [Chitinophagaceae bacterium]|nr:S8 family peptidase [Chitinophagaceae bacterium]